MIRSGIREQRVGRKSLLIEIPLLALVIGIGEAIAVVILLHGNSTVPVRAIALIQILSAAAWLRYLRGLISNRGRGST